LPAIDREGKIVEIWLKLGLGWLLLNLFWQKTGVVDKKIFI